MGSLGVTRPGDGSGQRPAELERCSDVRMGKVNWNVAPRGCPPVAHSRPPCAVTMDRLMLSPIPVPSALVVKKAWKISSPYSGDSPTPSSLTEIST